MAAEENAILAFCAFVLAVGVIIGFGWGYFRGHASGLLSGYNDAIRHIYRGEEWDDDGSDWEPAE